MRHTLVPLIAVAFGLCTPATLMAAEDPAVAKRPDIETDIQAKGPAAADQAKHLQRMATIDRLEALAKEQDNAALLAQVAQLRAQEASRHARVQEAHGKGKRPEHAGKPDGSGKPDHAGKPDGSGKPDHAGKPDGGGKPEHAGKPDGSGKPEHAGKPDGAGKPQEHMTPTADHASEQRSRKPDAAGKPEGAGKPAQAGKPTDPSKPTSP